MNRSLIPRPHSKKGHGRFSAQAQGGGLAGLDDRVLCLPNCFGPPPAEREPAGTACEQSRASRQRPMDCLRPSAVDKCRGPNPKRLAAQRVDGNTDSRGAAVTAMAAIDPKRSAMMARIGPRDTAPELAVRRALHRLGYRFRLHRRDLPGKPDVVLPRHRTIFLIHGCFWHRHPGCRFAYVPKSRIEFWRAKFEANVARDRRVEQKLRKQGWTVQIIWECETRDPGLNRRLREALQAERPR